MSTVRLRNTSESDTSQRPAKGAPSSAQDRQQRDLEDILQGLSQSRKRLPTRLLYDAEGSRIFEEICRLPEYTVTRTESALLRAHGPDIARFVGPSASVIEPGAGSGEKTRLLLNMLQLPLLYAPIDVDREALARCSTTIRAENPGLKVVPVHGDFTKLATLMLPESGASRRLLYFPGSTIGNFEPTAVQALLLRFRKLCGTDGRLLIGVDLRKNPQRLLRAYDDAAGVTARFNLNLLAHLNREFGATFDIEAFSHRAYYDRHLHRIEMHLVSRTDQTVCVGNQRFEFGAGEYIHTENSYKYLPSQFKRLAAAAGWSGWRLWMDPQRTFSIHGFEAAAV